MSKATGRGTLPKVTFIGGGSYTWGFTLLGDLHTQKEFEGMEVRLYDVNPAAVRKVASIVPGLARRTGTHLNVKVVDDLDRALDGTDYVIIGIAVGGLRELQHQNDIPCKYGIIQPTSQTTGPGMVVRTMINAPVFLDFARRMERLCPDAWILNFSNPLTTVGRIVSKNTKIKMIGICHSAGSSINQAAEMLGLPKDDLAVHYAGVNHGAFTCDVTHRGVSVFKEFRKRILENFDKNENITDIDPLGYASRIRCRMEILRNIGYLISTSDRHNAEFFQYFLRDGGKRFGVHSINVERRMLWMIPALANTMKAGAKDNKEPVKKSVEPANDIILARHFGRPYYGPVNLPNEGQVPNLPLGAVVESAGIVDAAGMRPVIGKPLPNEVLPYMLTQVAIHELAVEAAETGSYEKALAAVLLDPLTRDWQTAPQMLAEMIYASRNFIKHKVKKIYRPGTKHLKSKNSQLAAMASLSDRCLLDLSDEYFKKAGAGLRWDAPSLVITERIKTADAQAVIFNKQLDGNGRECLKMAKVVSAGYPKLREGRMWLLHGTRLENNFSEFVITCDQYPMKDFPYTAAAMKKEKTWLAEAQLDYLDLYHLSAFSVTVEKGKAGGILRRGVYLRHYAAFASLHQHEFSTVKELRRVLEKGMPDAVLQAGQKSFRCMDVLTYSKCRWCEIIPKDIQSSALLRSLKNCQTDLQACHALLLAGESKPVRQRHQLEALAGKVYFSLAEELI